MNDRTEKTVPARTVAVAFQQLVENGVDINLNIRFHKSGLTPFADSDYPAAYATRPPAWDFEEQWRTQVSNLQWHFPVLRGQALGFDRKYAEAILTNRSRPIVPGYMERWILVPANWHYFGSTYKAACLSVLSALKKTYPARDVIWPTLEEVREHHMLPNPATELALQRAAKQQDHRGLLLVPVQVGRQYAGRSAIDVLRELTAAGGREVGFGIIETALFLLYYPGRLGVDYRGLWIDTPGTLITAGDKLQSPFFRVSDVGKLEIKYSPVTEYDLRSGVATFYV